MTIVQVKVLFFGMLKDIVGRAEEQVELTGAQSLASVFDNYARRFPRLGELSASVVVASNRQFVPRATPVNDGDEIAFMPPVSGGAPSPLDAYTHVIEDPGGLFFALTRRPVDTAAVGRRILRPEDGALVNFEGVVRNNTKGRVTEFLDYECYEVMAIAVMADIGRDIARTHEIGRIAMVHRLGRMEIGETSVAVLVSAPHRVAAFQAALDGINRLKRTVPIWKKEHFAGGDVWVEGEWDASVFPK